MYRNAHIEIDDGPKLECFCPTELAADDGNLCIIESNGILESGRIVHIETVDAELPADKKTHKVLRRATLQDQAKSHENAVMRKMAMSACVSKAEKFKLEMRLVRVRYSFDRAVLIVLFTAEERVDFREMIKELTAELHTRIEMKQIGVRDESAIIGGMGPCGRALCCCSWLHQFAAVNIKAVKTQNISLNPVAITGMCGRLKCCLRYEYETYKEIGRNIPRLGSTVQCPCGKGCVVSKDVLKQRVRVRLDDHRVLEYDVAEVKGGIFDKEEDGRSTDEDTSPERTELESAGETGA
jgi:cell fate regulator YaaT (PSP1 superfamily)